MSSLLSNFDIAQQALKTSLESTGSAMAEHAKWSDSIEARLLKLQAAWQSFAQTFMSSDLLKGGITLLTGVVDVLDELVDKLGLLGTISLGTGIFSLFKMKGTGTWSFITNELSLFTELASEAWSSGGKLSTRIKNVGAAASAAGGDIAGKLTGSLVGFIGTAAAVTTAVALVYNAMKNAAEAASQARQDTIKASDDFLDASNSFEIAYAKYSGKTNLTSEEEAELENAINGTVDALNDKSSALQNAVNSSNDYVASLEAIAKEEREAAATMAKEKRIAAEKELEYINKGLTTFDGSEVNVAFSLNDDEEAINIAKDIGKDYYTRTPSGAGRYRDGFQLSANASADEIVKYYDMLVEYQAKLADSGLEDTKAYDNTTTAINKLTDAVGVYVDGVYDAAKAQYQLDNGIPKTLEEYLKMREAILSSEDIKGKSFDTKKTIAGTLDSEYSQVFDLSSVEAQARSLIGVIDKYDSAKAGKMEMFLNMRTAVNNGDCTVGEYISKFNEIEGITEGWTDAEKEEFNLTFGIDTDKVKKDYDTMLKTLSRGMSEDAAKEFLSGLSASELSAAVSLKGKVDWENGNPQEILKQIKEEAERQEILSFTIDISLEKEKLENLTSAISEAVSGTGLSNEGMSIVESMFGDLDSYDQSKLFERTANGIRLNSQELSRLNDEYANTNLANVNKKMSTLGDEYNDTKEELYNLAYGTDEYNSKLKDLTNIENEIKALERLGAQYEGLASSYNQWQMAESAGSQRDMYESIIEGFENVENEISRGWYDEGTIEFLELLTGKELSTASITKVKEAWKSVGETIEGTKYSVKDFFTTNEDGESTNTGVYNFLRAVEDVTGSNDVIKRKDGKIVGFDFNVVGGDKAIADVLNISEELVQIMLRAADDAGFVISMDGSYQQLDVLKEKAQEAAVSMNKALKDAGKETIDIDMNASSVEDVKSQLDSLFNTYSKDGISIDTSMPGGEEALSIASTLTSMLDKLSEPTYMDIETNQVEDDIKEPLSQLQELVRLTQTEHQVKLRGGDTSALEASKKEIYDYFETLDPEIKTKIGLVDDSGNPLTGDALKKKIDSGELTIDATVDIQLQMDEKLDILVAKAMLDADLMTEEEFEKKVNVYLGVEEVNTDEVDDKTEDAVNNESEEPSVVEKPTDLTMYTDSLDISDVETSIDNALDNSTLTKQQKVTIRAYAEVFGVNDIEELDKILDGLTDEQISIFAEVIGQIDVDKLKNAIIGLNDKTVQAIAEALGKGDVDGLKSTINGLDDKIVQAIAEAFGYENVDELNKAIENLDPKTVQAIAEALGITDVNSLKAAIQRLTGKNVKAVAKTSGENKVKNLKSLIDGVKGKTVSVVTNVITNTINRVKSWFSGDDSETSEVNGTAHVNGTTGRAFKQGSWGTKGSGTALVGELGAETLVRQGKYYVIGDSGAEFIKYQRGDIIFNHKQTEELFKNGRVTSGGGRAKALATGTAYSSGTAFSTGNIGESTEVVVGTNKNTGKSYTKSSDAADDFEETIDLIEIALSRVQRAIDNLDQKASNIYKSWSSRNSALKNEITEVRKEISLQSGAYQEYMNAANSVGLSSSWVNKIKNGSIDITTVTDEALKQKIDDFTEYYNKALECKDAIEELKEAEAELYAQRVQNVATQYEGILGVIEHEKNMLEEYISQSEAQGFLVSAKYYQALVSNEKDNVAQLKQEKSKMLSELETAMKSGTIAKGSESWYEMVAAVDEVTLAIAQSETKMKEWNQTIQQLKWEQFDLLQDKISSVTEEADFLIELLSSDKLYDDKGQLTDEGKATQGLYGQNYNSYMYQADLAGKEAARLKKELEADPYDTQLEERYREMLALQQEYILAANDEREAIRDLIEEGYSTQLDYLDELIQKKNDALSAEKELFEYQKKVEEQTKNIASLEKQLSAYQGDDSEEAAQKIQQIKVSLEDAKKDLEETEYDKLIDSTSALLDDLQIEMESIFNERIDNIDALLEQTIAEINADSSAISGTINSAADSVGYTLSSSMESIWSSNKDVITTYGDKFASAQTATNSALNTINTNLQSIINQMNKQASTNASSASNSSAANSSQANASGTYVTPSASGSGSSGGSSSSGSGKSYPYGKASETSGNIGQGARGNQVKAIQYALNKLGYGNSGTTGLDGIYGSGTASAVRAFQKATGASPDGIVGSETRSKFRAKGYASGKEKFLEDELAWTQEKGREMIIRPSDGAILTPIARGDSVLNATASGNIWNMANSPAEFIKNNLNLGSSGVPNNSSSQTSYSQTIENVTFRMDNVKNYDEMLNALKSDRRFEKLITAMSIDRINGGSKLAKNKSIR